MVLFSSLLYKREQSKYISVNFSTLIFKLLYIELCHDDSLKCCFFIVSYSRKNIKFMPPVGV